jgi:uncharacterized protein YdiU (UPF0061 family)
MNDPGFHFDNSYARLPGLLFTKTTPVPVRAPEVTLLNHALAGHMGLDFSSLDTPDQAALLSGNVLPKGAEPLAQAYAGHQFGHFTQLGDGRAILCGEHRTPEGMRVDIQFKGSGHTPYSRRGDGRATLGPMLREYLVSEAMHALKIPTTRSLAVVSTGETVYRETPQEGAILTRVAASHIRVGTFEYAAMQQDSALVHSLVAYTLQRHYPGVDPGNNLALALLKAVQETQADLITGWMRVGFVHGVMNTDNMALSGETIDYGPCAFMDAYNPATVFSSIDHQGRYAFGNQAMIAQWNLARFAETLLPLLDEDIEKALKMAEESLVTFNAVYREKWLTMMRAKLGLQDAHEGDVTLVNRLLTWMHEAQADYTNTFRDLGRKGTPAGPVYANSVFETWYRDWQARRSKDTGDPTSSRHLMQASNPVLIPRNHVVESALNAAVEGTLTPLEALLKALEKPYEDHPDLAAFQAPPDPGQPLCRTFCGT